jgi:cyclopropane fatty-acyl-phospholipid synthase-like methyltransferase
MRLTKICLLAMILFLLVGFDLAADEDPDSDDKMDLLYLPTPEYIVDKMLELAKVKKGDVVYDLGCGDGRVVVRAAKKYGVKGVGIDLNPERVKESLENVKEHKVEKLVKIKEGNVLKEDVSKASVVMLYILPELMAKLEPVLLKQLKPGSRVVSHAFMMDKWEPAKEVTHKYEDSDYNLYLYIVPKKDSKTQTKK